jgi:hypothetical protein
VQSDERFGQCRCELFRHIGFLGDFFVLCVHVPELPKVLIQLAALLRASPSSPIYAICPNDVPKKVCKVVFDADVLN